MARRGKQMTYEERLRCVQAAEGKSDAQVARETGWSVWTVRKWRRAYRKQGEAGLAPAMGRPKTGALGSYPSRVRSQLADLRRSHPGWGPLTLQLELAGQPVEGQPRLPSRARIAAFLKEQGLVRRYERHAPLPVPVPRPAQQAHAEWEVDAQGRQYVAGLGQVQVVNISDGFSRVKVASYPHLGRGELNWLGYQLVLRWAFLHAGLPERISFDHASTFFDNTSQSPYPTRLHLWLVALGIEVVFIEHPPPREHAVIERRHQTMTAQTLTGQNWSDPYQLWQGFDQRREFLNEVYPSPTWHGRAPLEVFPQARHSGRGYRPEWEAELLDLQRVDAFLAQGRWFRETNLHGEFWLGMQRYNAGRGWAHTTVELTFDPTTRVFLAQKVGSTLVQRFPAKGLTKTDLMGELAPFTQLPTYQLALPFSLDACRQFGLAQLWGGTTL